jgi:hypothetical protein
MLIFVDDFICNVTNMNSEMEMFLVAHPDAFPNLRVVMSFWFDPSSIMSMKKKGKDAAAEDSYVADPPKCAALLQTAELRMVTIPTQVLAAPTSI